MKLSLRNLSRSIKASKATLQSEFIYYKIKLLYPRVQLGQNVKFYGPIHLRIAKTASVLIGDNVIFRSSTAYNFVGINHPVSIYVDEHAVLEIGKDCGFSGNSIFASDNIKIGMNCNFGGNANIWDTDFHPLDFEARRRHDVSKIASAPIHIENDVFIGANSIILKGVTIGVRSIIGAGSVVTRSIPSDQVWAGNPARFIKEQYYRESISNAKLSV